MDRKRLAETENEVQESSEVWLKFCRTWLSGKILTPLTGQWRRSNTECSGSEHWLKSSGTRFLRRVLRLLTGLLGRSNTGWAGSEHC